MTTTQEAPIAWLHYSITVRCPKCRHVTDLAEEDAEHSIAAHIFNNDWDGLRGWEVTCSDCEHEFTIAKVEY